ncbi:hypothetical protein FHN55_07020 [Streptomyces sp. NP160]|uniref:hypothetical protein n=1 Tax=Streptomyces sp. NP160 TaxID=2586637 RepID=UPI00111BCA33|nr:hypothetical protein [Streptomyces sp. NP160]TNM68540.1 hypothetical protein FHN55_07020 [Streptomyces sp. NP160]
MATVLLLRCQVSPDDLATAARALEQAGLRVERAVVHPEPVLTAVTPVSPERAVLSAWADALDAAATELGAAGVVGHLALAGVQQRHLDVRAGAAALSR